MSLATAEAIRDRIYTLFEALTPTSLADVEFRRYRNEGNADFVTWAASKPDACFRRFQVREVGEEANPLTSNTTEERLPLEFEILIAYPQSHRYGAQNAMDRDDVAREDWKKIKHTIGIDGRGNFSSTNDCTPLGATRTRESQDTVDFMVIRATFEFLRSTT